MKTLMIALPVLVLGMALGCGPGTSTPAPAITSIAPANGNAQAGTAIIVTGSGFSAGVGGVSLGGVGIPSSTGKVTSDTQLTFPVPANAVTGTVAVATPGGTAVSPTEFVVVPYVSGTTATTLSAGVPAGPVHSPVTISGQGLVGNLSGTITLTMTGTGLPIAITPTTQTANQIIFEVPAGLSPGAATITINNNYGEASIAPPLLIPFVVTP